MSQCSVRSLIETLSISFVRKKVPGLKIPEFSFSYRDILFSLSLTLLFIPEVRLPDEPYLQQQYRRFLRHYCSIPEFSTAHSCGNES